ncbi:hydrolase [Bdellovibrio bacteriovorus W]|nr:hydrolase [Bdellovibrio bacteriovorus W]
MKTILFLILLSATPTAHFPSLTGQVVWNVGQGQWFTAITEGHCYHFDAGGEKVPWRKIHYHCALRRNIVFLSHWDWDHISFLKRLRTFKNVCLAQSPLGKSSKYKLRLIASIKPCTDSHAPLTWSPSRYRNPNEASHVFLFQNWLLPGDSPKKQENIWSQKLPLSRVRFLLLGHHGSRTSTSENLLQKLPSLSVAIASARHQRHGHPHVQVRGRLRIQQISLLRTEDWGNIWHL